MSELTFVCYSRCSTCKKAEKWLAANDVAVTVRDIKGDNPTEAELREWHEKAVCLSNASSIRAVSSIENWDSRTNWQT